MNEAAIETIKQSVSAVQAGQALGLQPNRVGFCKCPFHGDHDASLKLYSDDRGFCCFGCHKGGDVIRLVRLVNGASFLEAVEWLNSAFHLGLPLDRPMDKNAQKAAEIARKRKQEEQKQKQAIDRMEYDLYALCGRILDGLEEDKERYRPKRAYELWDERFTTAIRLIPEAKELAEELAVRVIGVKEN